MSAGLENRIESDQIRSRDRKKSPIRFDRQTSPRVREPSKWTPVVTAPARPSTTIVRTPFLACRARGFEDSGARTRGRGRRLEGATARGRDDSRSRREDSTARRLEVLDDSGARRSDSGDADLTRGVVEAGTTRGRSSATTRRLAGTRAGRLEGATTREPRRSDSPGGLGRRGLSSRSLAPA